MNEALTYIGIGLLTVLAPFWLYVLARFVSAAYFASREWYEEDKERRQNAQRKPPTGPRPHGG